MKQRFDSKKLLYKKKGTIFLLLPLFLAPTSFFIESVSATNLVMNSDFSNSVEIGFTTEYSRGVAPGYMGIALNERAYELTNNPSLVHSSFTTFGDHTTGNGNMMVANGSDFFPALLWSQTVNVEKDTSYVFSAWAATIFPQTRLEFSINSVVLGVLNLSKPVGEWEQFSKTWISANASSATLSIRDPEINYAGNDFAVDDISFTAQSKPVPVPGILGGVILASGVFGFRSFKNKSLKAKI